MDEQAFVRDILYRRGNDGLDEYRAEKNRQIKSCASEIGNVNQHKYMILSTNKPSVEEGRDRLRQVQGHLIGALSALGCSVSALDNNARLEILHNFFRIGEEGHFQFDFAANERLGQDFRDAVAPDVMRFGTSHIEIDDRFSKCMTITQYPQKLDDKFISTVLQQVPYIVLSIDITPIDSGDAFKRRAAGCIRHRVHADYAVQSCGNEKRADSPDPAAGGNAVSGRSGVFHSVCPG